MALPRCCLNTTFKRLAWSPQRRNLVVNKTKFISCSINNKNSNGCICEGLQVASLMKQEGQELKEMPILVRVKMDSILPQQSFTHSSKNGVTLELSDQDKTIIAQLEDCKTVNEIVKKVEIPSVGFTSISALLILQKILLLKETQKNITRFESHFQDDFINKLYKTINTSISSYSNTILISLVDGYCKSKPFQSKCTESISEEIEQRLWDSNFSVSELCSLSHILVGHNNQLQRLIQLIWVHMCHRDEEIDEKNLSLVFLSVPNIPLCAKKNVFEILWKKFNRVWWEIPGTDLSLIVSALKLHNVKSWTFYDLISKWLLVNINDMTAVDLIKVTEGYLTLMTHCGVFVRALELYVKTHSSNINIDLLATIMKYQHVMNYCSPKILDCVANNFEKYGHSCDPAQLYHILVPFGHFNYKPEQLDDMFLVAEEIIQRDFDKFEPVHITELLASFVYLDRLPLNFASQVLSLSFWRKCKETCTQSSLERISVWMSTIKYAVKDTGALQRRLQTVRHAFYEMRNISRKNIEISKNHERYFMLNILAELERRSCVVDLKYAFWNDTFFNFGALIFIDQDNKVVTLHDLIHYNHRKWFSEKVNTDNIEDITNKMLLKEKESSNSPGVANLSADKKTEKWISTCGDMSNEKETVNDDKYANFLPNMEGQYALCYPRFKERKDVTLESLQAKFGVFPGLSEVRIIPNLIFVRYSIKDSGVQCLEKYSRGLMMRVAEERMKKGSGEEQDYDLILKQTTSDNSVSDSEGSSNIDVPEVLEKLTRMISESQKDIFIVVDTGMLITDLDLIQGLTAHGKPALVFPWVVMQELDFLKKGKTSISSNTIETAKKARSAVQYLYQCFQSSHPRVVGQTPAQARIASEVSDFKAECSDDRILQCCIQYQSNNPDCSVLLLTKDLNLCNKSLINGIKAFPLLEGEQHFDNFKNNNTVDDRISIEDRKERDENLPKIEGLDLLFQTNDIMSQEGLINDEWQHETEKTYEELLQDIKYFTDTKIVKQQYRRLQDKIIDVHNSTLRQVAILPYTSDCFCKNTGRLLGEYAIQKKFLEERHFTVVEVKYSEMHKMREQLKDFIPLAHQTEPKHLRQLKHMIYQNRFPLYFISY
ncbi:unnamed protein product [Mytilus coruscus]|uniref:PIN domain-containing protein n=1 Tax=Mytilus coruscus TaxID=42192 RepID=A0A6J8D2X7_MYTCO|nr:unnamed protein product [Mytilus coruscus]